MKNTSGMVVKVLLPLGRNSIVLVEAIVPISGL